jgi:cysteine-rich repeat protein
MYFRLYAALATLCIVFYAAFTSDVLPLPQVRSADLITSVSLTVCGDGISGGGGAEVCDDGFGFNVGGYGSSTSQRKCNADCLSFGPYCGDGILQVRYTEACDDGNNASGDLCSAQCVAEIPAAPPPFPTVGTVPAGGGPTGVISGDLVTKVVLRGKAFPNSDVNLLLDGQSLGKVRADANADFFFTSSAITPGTATFGFWATDSTGVKSITTTVIFDVVQSAVTTVANVFIPPTVRVSKTQVPPGEPLTISGETVPGAAVMSDIAGPRTKNALTATAAENGTWALQVDTNSLEQGFNTVKAFFQTAPDSKSGYGKAVSVYIGTESIASVVTADVNGDGKVNLVDFSIFLLEWGGTNVRFDFNQDGAVSLADFSIMLFNWTG